MAKKNGNDLPKGVSSQVKNGSTYYYARIGGKKRYMGKGEKAKVRALAAKAKQQVQEYEGRDLMAGLDVRRCDFTTFHEMATWFMLHPTTQNLPSYGTLVARSINVLRYFGKHLVGAIQTDDMELYREHRKAQGAAEQAVNAEIGWMSMVYNKARKAKKIPVDAVPGGFPKVRGKELKKKVPPRRLVTDQEYEALLKATKEVVDMQDIIRCAWETSLRSIEIARLMVGQVHLDKVISEVPRKVADYFEVVDAKNGEIKYVPIGEDLRQVIERKIKGKEPGDLVFTNNGKMWSRSLISHRMRTACKWANVPYGDRVEEDELGNRFRPGIVFHCFRHTRISKWVEDGWSDSHIRLASGHKDPSVYSEYIHLDAYSVMRLVGGSRVERIKTIENASKSLSNAESK